MISASQTVLLVILGVLLFVVFGTNIVPAAYRNILGVIIGIVLVVVIINLIFRVFPF